MYDAMLVVGMNWTRCWDQSRGERRVGKPIQQKCKQIQTIPLENATLPVPHLALNCLLECIDDKNPILKNVTSLNSCPIALTDWIFGCSIMIVIGYPCPSQPDG